jgi:hypothetical protein
MNKGNAFVFKITNVNKKILVRDAILVVLLYQASEVLPPAR